MSGMMPASVSGGWRGASLPHYLVACCSASCRCCAPCHPSQSPSRPSQTHYFFFFFAFLSDELLLLLSLPAPSEKWE